MNSRYWIGLLGLTISGPLIAEPATTKAFDPPQELLELHEQGGLTVRALAAWGLLPDRYWSLALDLRAEGLDLLTADRSQIENWLDDAQKGGRVLSETQRAALNELTAIMDLRPVAEPAVLDVDRLAAAQEDPEVDVDPRSLESALANIPSEELAELPLGMFVAEALMTGDVTLLERALGQRKVEDTDAGEAVMLAATQGDLALIDLLLDAGLPIDVPDADGWTPLMMAVLLGRTDAALHLLARGADGYLETRSGLSAVSVAQTAGETQVLRAVGAEPSETHAWHALFSAVERRDSARAQSLLEAGWPLNAVDPFGGTALMVAAGLGDVESTGLLLEAGAEVDRVATDGATALLIAIQRGEHAIVELLLAFDANADGPEGSAMAPLVAAILVSDEYIGDRLLDNGASIEPLERAATALDPVVLAQEAGMDQLVARMQSGDQEHRIPAGLVFEQALASRNSGVMAGLFEAGRLSPNDVIDDEGVTIAMAMVLSEPFPEDFWQVVLRAGPDLALTDRQGRNLLHFAAGRGMNDVLSALIALDVEQQGEARDAVDAEGRSVLMYAATAGVTDVIQTLIVAGVDSTRPDHDGATPLAVAESLGLHDVADLLRLAGGRPDAGTSEAKLTGEHTESAEASGTIADLDDATALQLAEAQRQMEELLEQMQAAQRQIKEAQRQLEAARLQTTADEMAQVMDVPTGGGLSGPAVDETPSATVVAATDETDARAVLTVLTTPADAQVRIMNIRPRYRDRIELTPGAFDIEVSAPGFQTYRRFHRLGAGEQVLRIALEEAVAAPRPPSPPPAKDRMRDGSDGPDLVFVEGGTFRIGSPTTENGRVARQEQQREVTVGDFWMTRHPITVQDYRAFLDATRYRTAAEGGSGQGVDPGGIGTTYIQCEAAEAGTLAILSDLRQGRLDLALRGRFWRRPGFDQGRDHPVVCLTWREADAYARWLSTQTGRTYRLPTEAEWEYAARAGNGAARPWGEQPELACQHANVADETLQARQSERDWQVHTCADGHEHTSPAGTFASNEFGLHDMIGNVWEWTCSAWGATYGGQEQRCATGGTQRTLRGGSWTSAPDQARSASRLEARSESSSNDRGFRLVRLP